MLPQVRTYAADLTQRASLEALLQHITAGSTSSSDVTTASSSSSSSAISVSLLVANAGGAVPRFTSYWDYSDEDEAAMQALNGTACYVLVKKLLPNMVKVGALLLNMFYSFLCS
jgi:short-subunit dehydrogenase